MERFLALLNCRPAELVRSSDKRFAEAGLELVDEASAAEVVELLLAHPEVMQRPVVTDGRRAIIARPADRVLELL